ncbi:MAG: aromatic acid exporter family protein [Candidatus Nanopelagicales bacterium]|nr:aromatic acid exporter family protein [Candidatus Nanopelagicales bacterium]
MSSQRFKPTTYVRLAVLTSLAAFFAYLVSDAIPYAAPVPAAITAVIATRVTFHHATKEIFIQLLGALVGAAVALAIVSVIGSSAVVILLLVALSFVMARVMQYSIPHESPVVAASLAVTVILVVGSHLTTEIAIERFTGVVIGALFALFASFLASPTRDTQKLAAGLNAIQIQLAEVLARIARDLRGEPTTEDAAAWHDQAVELRNQVLGLSVQYEDLAKHSKWSPRINSIDLSSLKELLRANQVMSARVLNIANDLRSATRSNLNTQIPQAALSPLADLLELAATNLATDDPTQSIGVTAAHQAVRGADMTAQIALIGGIVSHVNQINKASTHEADDTGPVKVTPEKT